MMSHSRFETPSFSLRLFRSYLCLKEIVGTKGGPYTFLFVFRKKKKRGLLKPVHLSESVQFLITFYFELFFQPSWNKCPEFPFLSSV